jgi:hypothetical protein
VTDSTPRMLTVDQLVQLKRRWEKLGLVGVLDHLRPGLTDAEMDALTEPLGIVLPDEARVWWGWHDGTDPLGIDPIRGEQFAMLAPGRIFLPLGHAVRHCQMLLEALWEGREESHDLWRQWLPLNTLEDPTMLDCAADAPARVFRLEFQFRDRRLGLPTLGALVDAYIEAFDVGAWWLEQPGDEDSRWQQDLDKIEQRVNAHMLI